ncbi:apolipoprotein A-II-like [Salminus brasiliensis]|uniref:apolipoprotein A-II-like n=1 Tax=Salminus brasiliensis TaxID=930266 RepID=UPI003B831F78
MKFALIAALVVVLAIGSESASLVKREVPEELQKVGQYFQGLVDALKTVEGPELANMAKSYVEQSRSQIQPMIEKLQEQLKLSNIDDQIKPLAASLQAQIAPYTDLVQTQVEDALRFMVDQTKAIMPSQ